MTGVRTIGILAYPGVMALDVVGPLDAFAAAAELGAPPTPRYRCLVLGLAAAPFAAESGLLLTPHATLAEAPPLDTLIVPGGRGLREPAIQAPVRDWLRAAAPRCRRVASVCTGIYGLAATGLLDGRRVATHWRFAADVAQRYPRLRVAPDALYVADGPYWTSAGVTAGIDLALALIEADHGPSLALGVARELVVYLKRDGGQAQYSEPLRFQAANRARLADLVTWIEGHLAADLSVEALAARACVSPRHLTRQCRDAFSLAPAELVEVLRLDAARQRLGAGRGTIERVARSVGFRSADVFRRAFERRFGTTPRLYRSRFSLPATRHDLSGARGLSPARRVAGPTQSHARPGGAR